MKRLVRLVGETPAPSGGVGVRAVLRGGLPALGGVLALALSFGAVAAAEPATQERSPTEKADLHGVAGALADGMAEGMAEGPAEGPVEAMDRSDDVVLGRGWIRTFAGDLAAEDPGAEDSGEADPGARETGLIAPEMLHLPDDAADSMLARDVRAALAAALGAQGVALSPDAPLRLVFSVRVANEHEAAPEYWGPVFFAPPLSDPYWDDRFRERDRAQVGFLSDRRPSRANARPGAGPRAVNMAMYLMSGETRVWAGFASAGIGAYGRVGLAQAMARALAAQIGQSSDAPDAVFSGPSGPVGLTLVVD